MQSLLSEAAILPSLLHRIDWLLENLQQSESSDIQTIFSHFSELSTRLDNWAIEMDSENSHFHRSYHDLPRKAEGNQKEETYLPLWYPNITMANFFIHLWAFQIICLTETERLVTVYSQHCTIQPILEERVGPNLMENQQRITGLARRIYLSMDYQLQDEMELYGPASSFFPLGVAYQAFAKNPSERLGDITCIKEIVERLTRKGLLAAPALVFGS
jgi:hypothetical protein